MTYNDLSVGLLKRSTSHSSCLVKHMVLDILISSPLIPSKIQATDPIHQIFRHEVKKITRNVMPWRHKSKNKKSFPRQFETLPKGNVQTIGPIFRNSQTEVRIRSKDENHVNCKWNAGVCKCSWPSSMCLCSKVIGMCWARMLGNCTNTHQPQYMAHLQISALWSGKHCASSKSPAVLHIGLVPGKKLCKICFSPTVPTPTKAFDFCQHKLTIFS